MKKQLINKTQFIVYTSLYGVLGLIVLTAIIISLIKGNYLALGGWCCTLIFAISGFMSMFASYKASKLIQDLNKALEDGLIDKNAEIPSPKDVKNLHKKYFGDDDDSKE